MIKKYGIYIIVASLLIAASGLIYIKLNPSELAENLIAGTGNIDGDLITLNTKYPGRLEAVPVQEGQAIKRDDKVAALKSDEYQAKLLALNESILAAKERLKAVEQEHMISKESVPLEIKKARQAVEIALAQKNEIRNSIESLKEVVEQDRRDYDRTKTLYEKKLIGKQKLEYAALELTNNEKSLASLQEKLTQIEKTIEIAGDSVKLAECQKKKIVALEANVNASKKNIEVLRANKKELQIIIDELIIKSPVDGMVVEKVAHPGEVLGAGMIVATLIDPQTLYLKLFIDTMENGKIKIGDRAVIFLDAYPDRPMDASVIRIAQKAEFTPKEVSVRSDRIQRVYAVHIKPSKVDPLLKLGIPAIGIISLDGQGLPASLDDIPAL